MLRPAQAQFPQHLPQLAGTDCLPTIRCWEKTAVSLTVVCSSSASESLSSSAQQEGCKWGLPRALQLPQTQQDHQPLPQGHSPPRQHHPPKSRALAGCRCTGTFPQHQGSLQQAVNTSQEGGLGDRADQRCRHQALCHFHPRTHLLLPPTRLPAVATLPSSPCESSGGLYSALASSTLPSMATMSFLSTEET